MTEKTVLLAYHSANQELALTIDQKLTPAGYYFRHVSCNDEGDYLHAELKSAIHPILLLISDNFLRSSKCMLDLLPVFQEQVRSNRVKTVIVDGIKHNSETGLAEIIPTSFDRVSNVIKYMNHWQDEYLEVRRKKRDIPEIEEIELNNQLKVIRSISSEIGEFLRFLRNRDYTTLEEFQAEHYLQFFQFMSDMSKYDNWVIQSSIPSDATMTNDNSDSTLTNNNGQHEDEVAINLANIPGISLLADAEEEVMNFPSISNREVSENVNEQKHVPQANEFQQEAQREIEANKIEQAIKTLQTGIEAHPTDEGLRYSYAKALIVHTENYDIAKNQLETLLQLTGDNVDAHYLLGELAELREDYFTARFHFEKVIQIVPTYPNVNYRLGNILANKYNNHQEQAAALFEKAIQLDSSNSDAHYQYAVLQDEYFNQTNKAIVYFEKTLEIEPNHPLANYDLAVLFHRLGQFDHAKRAYLSAVDINPEVKTHQNDSVFLVLPELDSVHNGEMPAPFNKTEAENEIIEQTDETFEAGIEEQPISITSQEDLIEQTDETFEAGIEEQPINITSQEDLIEEIDQAAAIVMNMPNENTPPTLGVNTDMLQKLQEDIKRLESLLLSNQTLLQSTQQHLEEIPTTTEEEIEDDFPKLGAEKEPAKTVLITGATSGIGKATADIFAANGYRLILTGRRTDRLAIIKQQYEDTYGSEVLIQDFDVRDPLSVEEMTEKLNESWQNIDLLINNAGLAKGFEPIHEGKLEDWETMIDTNIKGLLYMTRMIAPLMVKRGGGQIINICSIAGKEVYPNGAVYCATKHAVDALTKGMRLDLHQYNIRVSQVAPAHVEETEFSLVRYDGDEEKSANVYRDFQPLKAIDVAETVYFMASRPNHVNIQDVVLYGTQQASATIVNRSGREKEVLPEEETTTKEATTSEQKLELTNI